MEEKQNVQLKLDTLQFLLKPHFIFNALTSIQNLMLKNDIDKSLEYSGLFSKFLRGIMQNDGDNLITLEEELKNIPPEQQKEEIRPVRKPGKMTKGLHDVIGGDLLSNRAVLSNLPFVIFLAILAMFYISNTYYTEKTFKQIEKIKNELKELRYQSITAKAKMLDVCKQTEIAKKVESMGIKGTTTPPYKIFYSKALLKKETDTLHRNP